MKKIFVILIIIFSLVLLFSVESKWYHKARHINILEKHLMHSAIGKVDPDGKIKAESAKEGYLAYGPYLSLKKGSYAVKYKLLLNNLNPADNPSKMAGYCDINIVGHPEKSFRLDLAAGDFQKKNPAEALLQFFVPKGLPQVEFRVYQYGGNNFSLLSLKLYPGGFLVLWKLLENNSILLSALLLLFIIYYSVKNKKELSFTDTLSSETGELEENDNFVSLNFLIQFGIVLFFSLLMFNAYWLNKFSIPIRPSSETIIIILELLAFYGIGKRFGWKLPNIKYVFLDSALFIFVFGFIFYVLLIPSMPAFMPVNLSNDCVAHYGWIDHIYNHQTFNGSVIASYPFGYHLTTVMLSKYTGIPAVKMMHILLVFSVALSTAILYALIVRIFNLKKDEKFMALLPVFTLFWVRGYYELSFNKFFHGPMIFSYLFMMSFFWALFEYKSCPKWFSYFTLNLSAIGLVYTYTSYIPMLIIPFFLTALLKSKIRFSERLKDMSAVILPSVILAMIHLKSAGTSKLGMAVLNYEGYCIPFRFWDFGDFEKNVNGGRFLILSLIGIPIVISSFKKNLAVVSFTFGVLFYFGTFFVLKHYFGKISYYQAYKILYFSPYIAVIYIASILYAIRKQLVKILKPFIGGSIYDILLVIWLVVITGQVITVYNMCNYKPVYPEMLKEPVFRTMDWARKNIKEKFDFIYHHANVGNWMRQGFMGEKFDDAYYSQVFVAPLPTTENWLKNAVKGKNAIVDDLNHPPLSEEQKKQFEIIYQKEYSAVIRKK
jgi:hypothetical protein